MEEQITQGTLVRFSHDIMRSHSHVESHITEESMQTSLIVPPKKNPQSTNLYV